MVPEATGVPLGVFINDIATAPLQMVLSVAEQHQRLLH
jgi:hypothetical protein